jgi:hypothetical protein
MTYQEKINELQKITDEKIKAHNEVIKRASGKLLNADIVKEIEKANDELQTAFKNQSKVIFQMGKNGSGLKDKYPEKEAN